MKNIDSDLIRGNIDTIILKTMLDEDKYGLDIIKEVEQRSNGTYELKQPTLYSCLKRLENQQLISSYWVNSDIGGRRHYYKLTDKGREFYNQKQEEWSKSKFVIDNLLSSFNYEEYRLVKKDDYDKAMSLAETANDELEGESQTFDGAENEAGVEENENVDTFEAEADDDYSAFDGIDPEFSLDETSEAETNDETDQSDDEMVYVPSENEPEEDETDDAPVYDLPDQSQNENNILNMLRAQKREEINTYEGDKKSYANQIRSIYDDVKYVQDDMVFAGSDEDEVDEKIKEFTEAAKKLEDFEQEIPETSDDFDEETTFEADFEVENDDLPNETPLEAEDEFEFSDATDDSAAENDENFDEIGEIFDTSEDDLGSDELENASADYRSELESNTSFFSSADDSSGDIWPANEPNSAIEPIHDEEIFEDESLNRFETENDNFEDDITAQNEYSAQNSDFETFDFSADDDAENVIDDYSASFERYENPNETFNKEDYDSTFVNIKKEVPSEVSYDTESPISSDIDSIISKNAGAGSGVTNNFYERRYVSENYKQKLSNLTVYSKASVSEAAQNTVQQPAEADDLETLKMGFEREGIKLKEFSKMNGFEDTEKTYLLTNKINLIKSLILLLGYVFVLSGVYIILQSTQMKYMEGFSLSAFALGLLPFVVVALYNLVVYLISPYKKVPAKYNSRIMLFLTVIVTVQLLLITYCVNLQLGLYSFTQGGYNHLLWIIPSIISVGPIVSNLIYMLLFKFGNFKV